VLLLDLIGEVLNILGLLLLLIQLCAFGFLLFLDKPSRSPLTF
jgi:hypothetical protein